MAAADRAGVVPIHPSTGRPATAKQMEAGRRGRKARRDGGESIIGRVQGKRNISEVGVSWGKASSHMITAGDCVSMHVISVLGSVLQEPRVVSCRSHDTMIATKYSEIPEDSEITGAGSSQ